MTPLLMILWCVTHTPIWIRWILLTWLIYLFSLASVRAPRDFSLFALLFFLASLEVPPEFIALESRYRENAAVRLCCPYFPSNMTRNEKEKHTHCKSGLAYSRFHRERQCTPTRVTPHSLSLVLEHILFRAEFVQCRPCAFPISRPKKIDNLRAFAGLTISFDFWTVISHSLSDTLQLRKERDHLSCLNSVINRI